MKFPNLDVKQPITISKITKQRSHTDIRPVERLAMSGDDPPHPSFCPGVSEVSAEITGMYFEM